MNRAFALVAAVLLLMLLVPPSPVGISGPFVVTEGQKPVPRWIVRVERSADNRRVYFLLMDDGEAPSREGAWRRSQEDLDGESPKYRYLSWATLPEGEFRLWVLLHTQTGEVARASVPVTVLARF
jgi:hypothetical protein